MAEAARAALPHGWFETRGADGKVVWRNHITMETSRRRPSHATEATQTRRTSDVWIPGRDAPKPTRVESLGREMQAMKMQMALAGR